jgi:phenylacetic acid degradation operon negative regulatory protein
MTPDTLDRAIHILSEQSPPRVWSLIVTLFGDLAQTPGTTIAGPVLAQMLAPLGVRPEAMRVALHRLRGEGWITAEKQGRLALYRLSDMGLQETQNASAQVYDTPSPAPHDWHIACFAPLPAQDEHSRANALAKRGYTPLAPGTYLINAAAPYRPKDALLLSGSLTQAPPWLASKLVPSERAKACHDLTAAIETLLSDIPNLSSASDMQRATLRTVIVHRWRRIALRLPPACDALLGQSWAGADCRRQVHSALNRLPRPHNSSFSARP